MSYSQTPNIISTSLESFHEESNGCKTKGKNRLSISNTDSNNVTHRPRQHTVQQQVFTSGGASSSSKKQKLAHASLSSANEKSEHEDLRKDTATLSEDDQVSGKDKDNSPANKRLSTITTSSYTRSKEKKNYVGPWKLGKTLGKGATGRVRLAKHSETGKLAAIKIIPKALFSNSKNSNDIEREIIIMKLISHPNIMSLHDVWENKGELYLILEYVEKGELFNYLVKKIKLNEDEAVHYFKQIIAGLNYCHSFNICHRDLKPENLLLDRYHNIKIADFGMAALEVTNKMLKTACGSPHYASPEVVTGLSYHGGPSDIWSCGVILYALLTGRLPFDDDQMSKLLAKVRSGIFRTPRDMSPEAKDLVRRMLTVDPKKRITMEEILEHPLLLKYQDSNSSRRRKSQPAESPLPKDIMKKPIMMEKIDVEILKNLQTLWHGEKKSKIVMKLMSNEENSEKLFYYLLLKYRQEHSLGDSTTAQLRSKKKTVVQTNQGETTARDLIMEKKLAMSKNKSLVSTTTIDAEGNTVTQISKEPLSKTGRLKSNSYKKLASSRFSITNNDSKMHDSHSRSSNLNNSTSNNNILNKTTSRDLEGNLLIPASTSRKSISFNPSGSNSKMKSTSSFKSTKQNSSSPHKNHHQKSGMHLSHSKKNLFSNKQAASKYIKNHIQNNSNSHFHHQLHYSNNLATSESTSSFASPVKKQRKSIQGEPLVNKLIDQFNIDNTASSTTAAISTTTSSSTNSSTSSASHAAAVAAAAELITLRPRRSDAAANNSKRSSNYKRRSATLKLSEMSALNDYYLNTEKYSYSNNNNNNDIKKKNYSTTISTDEFALLCELFFSGNTNTAINHKSERDSKQKAFQEPSAAELDDKFNMIISQLPNYEELAKKYHDELTRQREEKLQKEKDEAVAQMDKMVEELKLMAKKAKQLELENERLVKEKEAETKEKILQKTVTGSSVSSDLTTSTSFKENNVIEEKNKLTTSNETKNKRKSALSINSSVLNSDISEEVKAQQSINLKEEFLKNASKHIFTFNSSNSLKSAVPTTTFNFNVDKAVLEFSSGFKKSASKSRIPSPPPSDTSSNGNDSRKSSNADIAKMVSPEMGARLVPQRDAPKPPTAASKSTSNEDIAENNDIKGSKSSKATGSVFKSESTNTIVMPSPTQEDKKNFSAVISSTNSLKTAVTEKEKDENSDEPSSKLTKDLSRATLQIKKEDSRGSLVNSKRNAKYNTASNHSSLSNATIIGKAHIPNIDTQNAVETKDVLTIESQTIGLDDPRTAVKKVIASPVRKSSNSSYNNSPKTPISLTSSNPLMMTSAAASKKSATTTMVLTESVFASSNASKNTLISDDRGSSKTDVESRHSKTPSVTTASITMANPKTKQSWFSKVINNFVYSGGSQTSNSDDEVSYDTFLLLEDVQTLIRNSLNVRLKEGSLTKIKFESIGIVTVVPAKLAGGRSLKVRINIAPLKGYKMNADHYVKNIKGQKVLNSKKKTSVTVLREKGSAKAFNKMCQAIQVNISNEESQFRSRESRLT